MDPHTHTHSSEVTEIRERNSTGTIVGIIVLLLVVFALFYYGLPAIQSVVNRPAVQIPSQVDVNLNQQPAAQPQPK